MGILPVKCHFLKNFAEPLWANLICYTTFSIVLWTALLSSELMGVGAEVVCWESHVLHRTIGKSGATNQVCPQWSCKKNFLVTQNRQKCPSWGNLFIYDLWPLVFIRINLWNSEDQQKILPGPWKVNHWKLKSKILSFKVFLTQRAKLPIKYGNMIVYSDGVSHK